MNKHDKEILAQNWDLKKLQQPGCMDISSSCWVKFGTHGIGVYKYRNNRWQRKIVNDWKNLTFDEFVERFDKEEWELI